jgi:hypothetical protein
MSEEQKPTIDERLEALVQSLELMQIETEEHKQQIKALDARERQAREALLSGIAAYLRALGQGNGEK